MPSSSVPTASVIVTAYRADHYLREALAGALAQTRADFEVIVADDGASEATAGLVRGFADGRLRYVANATRLGVARNHWQALGLARGRYVAILNHDDRWKPQFLERLIAPLESCDEAAVAFCDHDIIDSGGTPLPSEAAAVSRRYGRDRLPAGLCRPFDAPLMDQSIPMVMGAVFRRSCLPPGGKGLFVQSGPAYDLCLAVMLWATGLGAWYLPERLTEYRVHGGSLTSCADVEWAAGAARCWDHVSRVAQSPDVRAGARFKAAEAYATAAMRGMRIGRWEAVRPHALLALRRHVNRRSLGVGLLAHLPRFLADPILNRGAVTSRGPLRPAAVVKGSC